MQETPFVQLPCRKALHSLVFVRFGTTRSSSAECAYLHVVDTHLPRSKKAHILVLLSCIITTLSLDFGLFSLLSLFPLFSLPGEPPALDGELQLVWEAGELAFGDFAAWGDRGPAEELLATAVRGRGASGDLTTAILP